MNITTGAITARRHHGHGRGEHEDLRRHDERDGCTDDHAGRWLGSDTPNFTETYDNKNVGTGKTLDAGRHGDATATAGNNYTIHLRRPTQGAITARALTVTAATNTKTYDGTTTAAAAPTITCGTLQRGDTATFTETTTPRTSAPARR